jgi:hypothetical protein
VSAAPTEPAVATGRCRLVLGTTAAALVIVDWAVKQVAERTLAEMRRVGFRGVASRPR